MARPVDAGRALHAGRRGGDAGGRGTFGPEPGVMPAYRLGLVCHPAAPTEERATMDEQDFDAHTEEREVPAFLQPLLDRLHASAKTETVFGPSRLEGDRRIVPVAKVSYGAGGGSGTSRKRRKSGGANPESEEGTGAGAGINVSPLGVFEVTDG